ncbi:MAG: hypothetical protein A2X08_16335 [Bacteroidetes bacterium GWA2_32_17]|nr:MAG: hypothetical protein A2X08_16335 [Bacteroidetes bacterium GWA2_32_17]
MKTFLESFSEHIVTNYSDDFLNSCVIFPSRRSGIFFRKQLADNINKTCWLPEITTLNEFITENSDTQLADNLQLIYKLYKVFCSKTSINENFDEFYFWGQVILSDFNDIDKELVDAEKLYTNLSDIKQIDSTFFELTKEQLDAIKQFWGDVDFKTKSSGKEKFIVLWEKLYPVYKEFNEQLSNEKYGYEGKIYRNFVSDLNLKSKKFISYKHIFIVGFNALSKAEKELFKFLQKLGNTQFFWDYDSFYYDDKNHEAGFFIREMLQQFPSPEKFQFETGIALQKSINLYSTQTIVGQAKILPEIFKNSNITNENTVLVLADENMLLPVLYSLPQNISKINVTMSYPVKETTSLQFVYLLLEMQGNVREKSNKIIFNSKDVLSILSHKFFKDINSAKELKNEIIKLNKNYIEQIVINKNDIFFKVFDKSKTPVTYCKYICDIIFEIISSNLILNNNIDNLEKQILYSIYRETIKLDELINNNKIELTKHDTFVKIFKQVCENIKVSFKGEPLAGLQIMGVLETRLLDFKNIILISANEGVIPASNAAMSLIPYNLRKGFGLQTLEHQDAIFAYHFYHLLQRSVNVFFIYSSSQNDNGKSEASRFIHQLRFNQNLKVNEYQVSDKPGVFQNKNILIERTEKINLKINKYLNNELKLSPSSINTYINCKLKFYFKHIIKLKEPDELTEDIDGIAFGNVFHKTLALLYQKYIGQNVTESIVENIKTNENIEVTLKKIFSEEIFKNEFPDNLSGIYLLNFQILKKYLIRLLEFDKKNSPFKIIGIEMNTKFPIKANNYDLTIDCFIDRCIEKEGKLIVQDFKTGNIESKVKDFETLFTANYKYSAMRQVIIYALSLEKTNVVKPELLSVRKVLTNENNKISIEKNEIKNIKEIKNEFVSHLQLALNELFDKNIPFAQTDKTENCKYCEYKQICRR